MELTIFLFWGLRYNLYIRWNFKIIKPSWKYVQFNKYYQVTFAVCNIQYMDWLYWYTNWLLGRDLSKFVSAIHKISILPSTISSNSPILFLMELIFWCEKIRLLRLQCRKRVKVTLIFSSYSWLVRNALIRDLIYLLNMLSTKS